MIIMADASEPTPPGGSVRKFEVCRFSVTKEGRPRFVCSLHGKRTFNCLELRMVQIAAAMRKDAADDDADLASAALERFTNLHIQQAFVPQRAEAEDVDCSSDSEGLGLPTAALRPTIRSCTTYDWMLGGAAYKAIVHTSADDLDGNLLVSHGADGQGRVLAMRLVNGLFVDNLEQAIQKARHLNLDSREPSISWLFGFEPEVARSRLLIETQPSAIWQLLTQLHSATCCEARPPPAARHAGPQWILSSSGGLHPFHPPWQHPSRHEPGLLQAAMLEVAVAQLRLHGDEHMQREGRQATTGSYLLEAFRVLDKVLDIWGRPEKEWVLEAGALPSTPSEVHTLDDALPLAVGRAKCLLDALLQLLPGEPLTLHQVEECLEPAALGDEDLASLLHQAQCWGILAEAEGGLLTLQLPPTFSQLTLNDVLAFNLTFCVRRCGTNTNVAAFAELLALCEETDAATDERPASTPTVPPPSTSAAICAGLLVESPLPMFVRRLAASECEASVSSTSFKGAVLLRTGFKADCVSPGDSVVPPEWLAWRCVVSFSAAAEVLSFSYLDASNPECAVAGLPSVWWLTTAGQQGASRAGSLVTLPTQVEGAHMHIWVAEPECVALNTFWEQVQQVSKGLGPPLTNVRCDPGLVRELNKCPYSQMEALAEKTAYLEDLRGDVPRGESASWLLYTVGGGAVIYAAHEAGISIAHAAAAFSLRRTRLPQGDEPPCVVRSSFSKPIFTLLVWCAPRTAALPPRAEPITMKVAQQHLDQAEGFAQLVQQGLRWPQPNIRAALPPPPSSDRDRRLVETCRRALGSLRAAAPFLLKRLILLLRPAGGPMGRSAQLLLAHQRSILLPAPPAAAHREVLLAAGQNELAAAVSLNQRLATEGPSPLSAQLLGGLGADVPLSAGGASVASLGRVLRSHDSFERLSPWALLDQLASAALEASRNAPTMASTMGGGVSPSSGSGAGTGSGIAFEILAHSRNEPAAEGGTASTVGSGANASASCTNSEEYRPTFPFELRPSIIKCARCDHMLRLVGPKRSFLLTEKTLTFMNVYWKQCTRLGCQWVYPPMDVRDTFGLVCAAKICYPVTLEVSEGTPSVQEVRALVMHSIARTLVTAPSPPHALPCCTGERKRTNIEEAPICGHILNDGARASVNPPVRQHPRSRGSV
jgi:hypothetical protein